MAHQVHIKARVTRCVAGAIDKRVSATIQQWHCGADLLDEPDTEVEDVCFFCKKRGSDTDFVKRKHGQPCPRCGVRGEEWCQVWSEEGRFCMGHAGSRRRHPLAPMDMKESRRAHQRALALAAKARPLAEQAADLARALAASSETNAELAAAVAQVLKAAQVAALTADTGAGQTVVMAPPDVRPIPAPIGVLRDELMRTLK